MILKYIHMFLLLIHNLQWKRPFPLPETTLCDHLCGRVYTLPCLRNSTIKDSTVIKYAILISSQLHTRFKELISQACSIDYNNWKQDRQVSDTSSNQSKQLCQKQASDDIMQTLIASKTSHLKVAPSVWNLWLSLMKV